MKVLKFGGTSVGSTEGILNVKRIVESQQDKVIVVVSALGGVTDKLIAVTDMAMSGDLSYKTHFKEIVTRHEEVMKEVTPPTNHTSIIADMHLLFDELLSVLSDVYSKRNSRIKQKI